METSKTDKAVVTVAVTTLLTFLIVNDIGSIWLLYPNLLIAIGLFGYCIWQNGDGTSLLSRSLLFGFIATLTYIPMDWLFSRKVHLIFYLRPDFLANMTTPIGLILSWVVFATLTGYCYQQLEMICRNREVAGTALVAAATTGIGAAVGSTVIYGLGSSHLWTWNAKWIDTTPHIASVPLFVPVAFLLTFLLCPYYFHREQHAAVAGIRCGIFMGALQFFCFLLFYIWR